MRSGGWLVISSRKSFFVSTREKEKRRPPLRSSSLPSTASSGRSSSIRIRKSFPIRVDDVLSIIPPGENVSYTAARIGALNDHRSNRLGEDVGIQTARALRTNAMGECRAGMFLQIHLKAVPVTLVIANILARGDRKR